MTSRLFQLGVAVAIAAIVIAVAVMALSGDRNQTDALGRSPSTAQSEQEIDRAPSAGSGAASEVENDEAFRVIEQGQVVGGEG